MLFICLEGLDGVGKSTVGKIIAKKMCGVFLQTPGEPYKAIRCRIDAENCLFTRYYFYLSSVYRLSNWLKQSKDNIAICDRYLYSTLAYNWPHTDNPDCQEWGKHSELLKPDITFFLAASFKMRQTRLLYRKKSTERIVPDDTNPQVQMLAANRYAKFNDMVVVDTEDISANETASCIISHLHEVGLHDLY